MNPFILFDEAKPMHKKGLPPFGLHPHHGLQVATLLWNGAVSSLLGTEAEATVFSKGPEGVVAMAGRGLTHDEHSATDEETTLGQLIWLIPEASRSKPLRVAESANAGQWTPVGDKARVHVVVGSAFGADSKVETESHILVVMAELEAGGSIEFETVEGGAFVYPMSGELTIDGNSVVAARHLAILTSAAGKVSVQNTSPKDKMRLVFGNGKTVDEPWVKLLTHNGFLIARNLDAARKQEEIIKQVGLDKYGSD